MEPRLALSIVLLLIATTSAKLLFVNEVCRHGARAPEVSEYSFEGFPNGKGMLTASGFRQHYLIGHQLRKRYVKTKDTDEKLLSLEYTPDEIYVRSTQVERTIQSAQAQLLGLYPLGSGNELDFSMFKNSRPHIDIYDEFTILKELGTQAIPGDYQPIPVHNFGLYVDDMTAYGFCPYMVNDYINRSQDATVWQKYDDYFRPLIYEQISKAFDITPDQVNFQTIYPLSDILWAEDFQGIQNRYKFTSKEWDIVKQIQLPSLVELLSDVSNKIMVSRFMNPVVEMMKSKIGVPFNQTLVEDFKDAKFLLFSNHDYQLSHILKFLAPQNIDYQWIDYASILLFELHKFDRAACRYSKAKNCHYVKAFYNNDQLKLPGCKDLDCYFDEFEQYISRQGYTYKQMDTICNSEDPLPETHEAMHLQVIAGGKNLSTEMDRFNSMIYS